MAKPNPTHTATPPKQGGMRGSFSEVWRNTGLRKSKEQVGVTPPSSHLGEPIPLHGRIAKDQQLGLEKGNLNITLSPPPPT